METLTSKHTTLKFIIYFLNADSRLQEWCGEEDGNVFFKMLDLKFTLSRNSKLLS